MTTKTAAQQMLDQVRDGKTVYTKSAGGVWMVVGPAAIVTEGADVTATRADGSTSRVQVSQIVSTGEKQGVSYTVATFRNLPAKAATSSKAPATDAQIDLILTLLARRERNGDGGGFMTVTDTSREGLAKLTRADASAFITSLQEDY